MAVVCRNLKNYEKEADGEDCDMKLNVVIGKVKTKNSVSILELHCVIGHSWKEAASIYIYGKTNKRNSLDISSFGAGQESKVRT